MEFIQLHIDGGSGHTRDALPVGELFGELLVHYQRSIWQKSYYTEFREICFYEMRSTKCKEVQKAMTRTKKLSHGLLNIFVEHIGRQRAT